MFIAAGRMFLITQKNVFYIFILFLFFLFKIHTS